MPMRYTNTNIVSSCTRVHNDACVIRLFLKRSTELQRQRNIEIQNNLNENKSHFGAAIKYGEVIQLRHVKSQKFLTILFVLSKFRCPCYSACKHSHCSCSLIISIRISLFSCMRVPCGSIVARVLWLQKTQVAYASSSTNTETNFLGLSLNRNSCIALSAMLWRLVTSYLSTSNHTKKRCVCHHFGMSSCFDVSRYLLSLSGHIGLGAHVIVINVDLCISCSVFVVVSRDQNQLCINVLISGQIKCLSFERSECQQQY